MAGIFSMLGISSKPKKKKSPLTIAKGLSKKLQKKKQVFQIKQANAKLRNELSKYS